MNHPGLLPPNTAPATIPLHCSVCPKKPNFSDLSHLLTHIASKGHVSHYYKLDVQAPEDPVAARAKRIYDDWYRTWNVNALMNERIQQKENRKKTGARGNANGNPSARRTAAANNAGAGTARNTQAQASRRPTAVRETLDPQLDRGIKTEPTSRSNTPGLPISTMEAAALSRSYAPPMQSWPTTPYAESPLTRETSILDSLYGTPSTDSGDIDLPVRTRARATRANPDETYQLDQALDDELEFDDRLAENTKLKGVFWHGMGMFDSATADMRRKRNQKKAISVIDHLERTSSHVEPTELVFDQRGILSRERPITGNPDSDDGRGPLRGETPPEPDTPQPPKKRKTAGRKPRHALTEKNPNSQRDASHRGEFGHGNSGLPYFDGAADDDDDTAYGQPRPGMRIGVSIHRDNSGPDITFDPPQMGTLTSGFRPPFQVPSQQRGQAIGQNGNAGHGYQHQPSLPFGQAFRSATNNPLGGMPQQNLGSFGHLNGMPMFHHISNPFNFNIPPGAQALAVLQQQFGGPQQSFNEGQGQGQHSSQGHAAFDPFTIDYQDMNVPIGADAGMQMNADPGSGNPLFFSSNQPVPDDDETTLSPPASGR